MKQAINTTRPVQLQVNLAGAWKTVLHFDAGNVAALEQVRQGALMLHLASPDASFRISTTERNPNVLNYLGKNTYGMWIDSKGAF